MSEKNKNTPKVQTPKVQTFAYRNIKKEFIQFKATAEINKQRHLELTEFNGTKIVDDRNVDWAELAKRDADTVGLANILALSSRNKQNLAQFAIRNAEQYAFKDTEACDISMIDPMKVDEMQALAVQKDASYKKLEGLASQLGVSVDTLVDSFYEGGLQKLISEKLTKEEKNEEGGKE